mmetsp:Transcript_18399/g.37334  ORF Transcript_18399/g.37334 Transcript_18399/m.37334 type:complete len:202 (+) Transcript_18399:1003-1608(+)
MAGFEDSVWVREAVGDYDHQLIVSAHINDTLMACTSLETLQKFKTAFLERFDGTDKGSVTSHLACKLIRDRPNRTILLRQAVYTKKMLQLYDTWDKPTVKTPLEPGVCLTTADCPAVADPGLHRQYRCITGHLSYLVTMTRCDLAFACAELSKIVQCPGEAHLRAAKRVLQYLRGTYMDGLLYSDPGPAMCNKLLGWVDSD